MCPRLNSHHFKDAKLGTRWSERAGQDPKCNTSSTLAPHSPHSSLPNGSISSTRWQRTAERSPGGRVSLPGRAPTAPDGAMSPHNPPHPPCRARLCCPRRPSGLRCYPLPSPLRFGVARPGSLTSRFRHIAAPGPITSRRQQGQRKRKQPLHTDRWYDRGRRGASRAPRRSLQRRPAQPATSVLRRGGGW